MASGLARIAVKKLKTLIFAPIAIARMNAAKKVNARDPLTFSVPPRLRDGISHLEVQHLFNAPCSLRNGASATRAKFLRKVANALKSRLRL